MYRVFEFADVNLGFPAPGFFRRFDYQYISEGLKLGYECGYRSQRLFAYFSLSIWLIHLADIQNELRFRCLGDLDSSGVYNESYLSFGVKRISDEVLFYATVFGNWADAQRYSLYIGLQRHNRGTSACRLLLEDPFEDQELQASLLKDNECSHLETISNWRR
jgi:hypothetical protein